VTALVDSSGHSSGCQKTPISRAGYAQRFSQARRDCMVAVLRNPSLDVIEDAMKAQAGTRHLRRAAVVIEQGK